MLTPVPLPALGESVTEGTVSRWLKQVGDTVEVDEPIVEVSTDKVDTEIPSPAAGVILEIKVGEDEVAPVGAVLALIGDPIHQSVARLNLGNVLVARQDLEQALLAYAELLTLAPWTITPAHIQALRAAGCDDRAFHDACAIVSYFAFVNRIADGLGVELEG